MGAWSHESFGNDDACDFAAELAESEDLSAIEGALDAVLKVGDEYLEAPEASQAIAAAEAVSRLQGNWGERDSYSEAIDSWVEKVKLKPNQALLQKTHQALDRILTEPSELKELWEESEEAGEWIAAVKALKVRVRA
jgi:hypothetical protein